MISEKLTCIVIEDEEATRNWIIQKIGLFKEVEVLGSSAEINEAFEMISSMKPDFIFLDFMIIGGDAFQLIDQLKATKSYVPYIIVATAYQDFIFDTFNKYRDHVLQYLMKPFIDNWHRQFREAIDSVIKNKKSIEAPIPTSDHIFIPDQGSLIRLDFSRIIYLAVAGNGKSRVVLDDKELVVDITLTKFMDLLPSNFFRIHRYNSVNLDLIENINRGDRTLAVRHPNGIVNLGISDKNYNELLLKLPVRK